MSETDSQESVPTRKAAGQLTSDNLNDRESRKPGTEHGESAIVIPQDKQEQSDTDSQESPAGSATDPVCTTETSETPSNRWLFGFRTSFHWTRIVLIELATVATVVTSTFWAIDRWGDDVENTQISGIAKSQDETNYKLDLLTEKFSDKARELHLTEKLFITLAKRIAEDVPDIDQAFIELERVVEVAAQEQDKDALPGNTDEAVEAVFRRVDKLNADGQIDTAAELIANEESRAQAGLLRLYDKGIAQAILTRDVDVAHDYELKKLSLDALKDAQFEALRRVQDGWYARGRDKGLKFDLEVSIALARTSLTRAQDADQRGAAQNDLGIALWTLGARESGTARLEEAVEAYRAALEEYTQARVPLEWATTQNNLGTALQTLGARESGTGRLEEAVETYRAALEERTQARVPLSWAMTQENLALVEVAFADHPATADSRSHLKAAFAHVEAALLVLSTSSLGEGKTARLRDQLQEQLTSGD